MGDMQQRLTPKIVDKQVRITAIEPKKLRFMEER